MSIERIFYCDGPDCDEHVRTASTRATAIITVTEDAGRSHHFCTWDCVMRYAAAKPPTETIPFAAS